MRRLPQILPTLVATLALAAVLPAQRTRIVLGDARFAKGAPEGTTPIYVLRESFAPGARAAFCQERGLPWVASLHPDAAGPALFGRRALGRIPGDPRLRVELPGGIGLTVLGLGATAKESTRRAQQEPLEHAILIGTDPKRPAPQGWKRLELPGPCTWMRGVDLVAEHSEDGELHYLEVEPTADLAKARATEASAARVPPQGPYPEHLQGIARDPAGHIYWSWTDRIVKTDAAGKELVSVRAPDHQGDLCWRDGRIVVAVNLGKFNDLEEAHDSWAFVYRDSDLQLLEKHRLPEARFGAGGICFHDGRYFVVGGYPREWKTRRHTGNEVHEYDAEFGYLRTRHLRGAWTRLGIQTAEFAFGRFWFGCYGDVTLIASPDLRHVERRENRFCAYGVAKGPGDTLLVGTNDRNDGTHTGGLELRTLDWFWR